MGKSEARAFAKGVGATYLLVAAIGGMAMKAVLPALNPLGVAYVGLTWPVAMSCVALRAECSAVPPQRYSKWLFTFDKADPPKEPTHDQR